MVAGEDTDDIELEVWAEADDKIDFSYDNPVDVRDESDDDGEVNSSPDVLEEMDRIQYGIPFRNLTGKRHKYSSALKTLKPFRGNKNKEQIPVNKAGLFSYLTCNWLSPIIRKARNEGLEMHNIWKMPPQESTSGNVNRLQQLWEDEVKKNGAEFASFRSTWFRFIRTRFAVSCFLLIISLAAQVVSSAYVVESLLNHLEEPKTNRKLWMGLVLATAMLIAEVLRAVFYASTWLVMDQAGIRLRGAVVTLIYRKLVRLKSTGNKSIGELVNICVNDSQRLFEATALVTMLLGGPVALVVSGVYGYYILGPWSFLGNAIFVLFFPIQMCISKLTTILRANLTVVADKRIKQMTEILTNIKFIKLYAWERPFESKLKEQRQQERSGIEKLSYVRSTSTTITPFIPILANVCTVVGHAMTGNDLTATQAFTILNLFTILFDSIRIVPTCIRNFAEAGVSCDRIKSFLLMDTRDPVRSTKSTSKETAVRITRASFSWNSVFQKSKSKDDSDKKANCASPSGENGGVSGAKCDMSDEMKPVLFDIYVNVDKGELVGICGPVGSGKSSLLCSLMDQLKSLSDTNTVQVHGSIAYASQSPWIFRGSVRENITFGSVFDKSWYDLVVQACSLVDDFKTLPNGDETEIGERGSNLSGGQKQRINLARAVYSRREVVLLDDPLSAVDVHVGEHIFHHCIETLLHDKTVLLVTHQLQTNTGTLDVAGPRRRGNKIVHDFRALTTLGPPTYLSKCTMIIYMEDGKIVQQGRHENLMMSGGTYSQMMMKWQPSDNKSADDTAKTENNTNDVDEKKATKGERATTGKGKLVQAERKKSGSVGSKVYLAYIRASGGWCVAITTLLLFVVYIACTAFSNWFLSYWIKQGSGQVHNGSFMNQGFELGHDIFRLSLEGNTINSNLWTVKESSTMFPTYSLSKMTSETGSHSKIYSTRKNPNATIKGFNVSISTHFTTGALTSRNPLTSTTFGNLAFTQTTESTASFDLTKLNPSSDVTSAPSDVTVSVPSSIASTFLENTDEPATNTMPTSGESTAMHIPSIISNPDSTTPTSDNSTDMPSSPVASGSIKTRHISDVTAAYDSGSVTPSYMPSTPRSSTAAPPASDSITNNPRLHEYVMIYGLTAVGMLVIGLIKALIFVKTTIGAANNLHNKMFARVVRSPLSFFDTNPVGRIINRFSKDMDEVDSRLPFMMETFIHQVLLILAALLVISVSFPFFLAVLIPLTIALFLLNKRSVVGIRELKRLDNISRSPLLSQLTATLEGLHTIQAFNKENEMETKFNAVLDANSAPFFLFNCGMRWLTLRLDVISVIMTASVAFVVVLTSYFAESETAMAGLALSYAIQMSVNFHFTVRLKTEVEARFTSVERLEEYAESLEQEAPDVLLHSRPPKNWPSEGHISFNHLDMRYRDNLPLSLSKLVLEASPGEKIGIVGRTGAGKSSILASLFRLVEPAAGSITIDGIDIGTIGLKDLRSRLSVIPQDPVLFPGTIRYNLDPLSLYPDDRLWTALEHVHMKDKIVHLPQRLDSEVHDCGRNFSVGERQLICMARVLLKRNKILLLDEATAAVDTQTDANIQATIRNAFEDCTLLTIAHRLNTVVDSDKIVIMEQGEIVEQGSPGELLKDPQSKFYGMMSPNESLPMDEQETGHEDSKDVACQLYL